MGLAGDLFDARSNAENRNRQPFNANAFLSHGGLSSSPNSELGFWPLLMPMRPKVFISYVSADRELATQLRADLEMAGADPWQFDYSAIPGTDAWDVILNRIAESDYFLVLLSPQALQSQAVREEIDHAHYSRLNGPEQRPVQIPLILDDSI